MKFGLMQQQQQKKTVWKSIRVQDLRHSSSLFSLLQTSPHIVLYCPAPPNISTLCLHYTGFHVLHEYRISRGAIFIDMVKSIDLV